MVGYNTGAADYLQELKVLRDKMHCEIVQEATVRTFVKEDSTDGILLLDEPFRFYFKLEEGYSEERYVLGIDCNTGVVICEDIDNRSKFFRYTDLTLDELGQLHKSIVINKEYKFTLYDEQTL
jgi:hypothetical protein